MAFFYVSALPAAQNEFVCACQVTQFVHSLRQIDFLETFTINPGIDCPRDTMLFVGRYKAPAGGYNSR
jgi:hypothetical protein